MDQSTVGNVDDAGLSAPRLETYLNRCHGDRDEAMRLYEWNTSLGRPPEDTLLLKSLFATSDSRHRRRGTAMSIGF